MSQIEGRNTKSGWLPRHWKQLVIHVLILGIFAFYCFFLAESVSDSLEGLPNESRLQDVKLPGVTNNIRFNIDLKFEIMADVLEIEGWAFIQGEDSEGSQTYLVLRSDDHTYVFNMSPESREDVARAFNKLNTDLRRSGFNAIIPLRKIVNGEYNVGILIARDKMEALQYTDKAVVKGQGGAETASMLSKTQQRTLPPESENITYWIDSQNDVVTNGKNLIEIKGWAFINGHNADADQVFLVLKSDSLKYIYDTWPQSRPDITGHFSQSGLSLDNSGFKALIPKEGIRQGKYILGIYIKQDKLEVLRYTNRELVVDPQ